MKKIIFKGCGTAIVTPFITNEQTGESQVNYAEFEKLIEFQIQNKADAIIVCGTTGESSTMTHEEKENVIKFAIQKVNRRIPVVVGTGSNCTIEAIKMTKFAEACGADGALIVTPYYNKTTQAGLMAHYSAIAKATTLPIIMYSVPSRTGVNILPETCLELSKIENIVAIKEASGNLSQIAEIANLCKENLNIYSGNDDQITPILSVGGIGVISVLSNIMPNFTHDIVFDFLNGDVNTAISNQIKVIPFIKMLFTEVNPIPVKSALNMFGYNVGIPRLPLVEMSEKNKEKLKIEMEKLSLI